MSVNLFINRLMNKTVLHTCYWNILIDWRFYLYYITIFFLLWTEFLLVYCKRYSPSLLFYTMAVSCSQFINSPICLFCWCLYFFIINLPLTYTFVTLCFSEEKGTGVELHTYTATEIGNKNNNGIYFYFISVTLVQGYHQYIGHKVKVSTKVI